MIPHAVEILLVEDNPNDIRLAMDAFESNHLANRVEVLRDGAEALDYLFREGVYAGQSPAPNPKVLLLDLKLPLVDGLEVLEKLKADPRTRHIPVVVLTSSQEDLDISRAYQLGANSYIVKPVEFDKLTEVVKHLGFYWLLLNQAPNG